MSWPLVALYTVVILAGANAISWYLYRYASDLLETSLDDRLLAVGRAAVPMLEAQLLGEGPPRGADASRYLADLRAQTALEQAFVLDRDIGSLADARPGVLPETRYDLLRLDPGALERAIAGEAASSPRYEIEGFEFKGAYLPLRRADGDVGAVLYLEASVELVASLGTLRQILTVAGVLSAVLAIALGLMAGLGLRTAVRATERESRRGNLEAMGRMAAEVAHEIKNPLGTVLGCVEVLEDRYFLPPGGRSLLTDMREELRRVNRLVEDFLALAPNIAPTRRPHDLNALVRSVADVARVAHAGEGVTVELELDDRVGLVAVDADRIRQVLLNLLLNAFQALEGRGSVRVQTLREAPEMAVIAIADDGPGMSPEMTKRALDPFFSTKENGTGLGLAVASHIVEAHGGELRVRSRRGHGTTCEIRLPCDITAPAAAEATFETTAGGAFEATFEATAGAAFEATEGIIAPAGIATSGAPGSNEA